MTTDTLAQDLAALLQRSMQGSARDTEPLRALFDKLDLDKSGTISIDELEAVINTFHEPLSPAEVNALMRKMDANGDGEVDYEEFKSFVLNLTSFDRHHQVDEFQSAYEQLGQVLLDAAGHVTALPEAPAAPPAEKVLRPETINPCVRKMQYAVRGAVPMLAEKINQQIKLGQARQGFDEVLFCNIGNPQSVGQLPITFYRQALALCDCPELLEHETTRKLFAEDAIERARRLLAGMVGGTGAYSHSQGLAAIRRDVAAFIEARDGYPSEPADIFLTNGASSGITLVLQTLLGEHADAVLIPIPQYPIYSATVELLDAKAVGYQLDEDAGWKIHVDELERVVGDARARGLNPRGMVIINPGNPTGQCLDAPTLEGVVRFCHEQRLVLLADEVYQENVYGGRAFVSAKRVVRSLGSDFDGFELVSFHSTSKGVIGECGRRGGYMEICGLDPRAKAELFKLACVGLCPNLDGQVMTQLMVDPPAPGEPSFERFTQERQAIFGALERKSQRLVETINALEGVHSQPVEGAMYAFPRLELPRGAVAAAEAQGQSADMLYCLSLLERTGICTVPGSGFGQAPGTHHLRMTFLPPADRLDAALERFCAHHVEFMGRY